MVDLSSEIVSPEATDGLPPDWREQLERGLARNYLVGYDPDLDEVLVWFTTNRDQAVHYPLTSLIEIVIDDESGEIIGMATSQFTAILLTLYPDFSKFAIRDDRSGIPRLPDYLPMTPLDRLSFVIPVDTIRHVLGRTAATVTD